MNVTAQTRPIPRLPYVQSYESAGVTYHYFRKKGRPLVRLPGAPGERPFMRAYNRLLGQPATPTGTTKRGYIYFIEAGPFIKIGFSTKWSRRIAGIQTSTPQKITVLHVERGTIGIERRLHRLFGSFRSHGEWFRKAPEIMDHIAFLRGPK